MPLMMTFFNVRKGRDTLFKRGMRHLFPKRARETASSQDVPALVIVGEKDVLTPPSEAEELAALLPIAQLVRLPGAGHMTPLEAASP